MDQPWVLIVLVGLVLIVYAKMQPSSKRDKGSSGVNMKELEETMEHFAAELEEQNQALIGMFAETKKEYAIHTAKLTARIEALEKHNQQQQQELLKLSYALEQLPKHAVATADKGGSSIPVTSQEAIQAIPPTTADEQEPVMSEPVTESIKQRYGALFELYDQGKSIEMIAKKLGMNKGEVSLIIQLAKQEERVNA
jgi:DNA-binding NarL/FixJ family response regulator